MTAPTPGLDVAALRRLNEARRDQDAHWNAREVARNALQSLLMRETDAILAALEEQEGLRVALSHIEGRLEVVHGDIRYCMWCETSQDARDARAMGHASNCIAWTVRDALARPRGGGGERWGLTSTRPA